MVQTGMKQLHVFEGKYTHFIKRKFHLLILTPIVGVIMVENSMSQITDLMHFTVQIEDHSKQDRTLQAYFFISIKLLWEISFF